MPILLTIFATSFMVALSGALMPGPLMTVTIGESPRRGYITGPLLILGHGLLEAVLVAAIVVGLAPVLRRPAVFIATAVMGAVVLGWMAWGMFRALPSMTLRVQGDGATGRNLVASGALLSLANPYWSIWWVTIGLGYITQSLSHGVWGLVVFFGGHILADLAWYSAISTAIWKGGRFIGDRTYRWMIAACAAFLVVFAGLFAVAGLRALLD
jgi:threonine/homoserine/homoserine lactone efflux protein